jgi:hypothetical protein
LTKLANNPSSQDVQQLRMQLTSQTRGWLNQFYSQNGLTLLLHSLHSLSSLPYSLMTEEQARKQLELLRCIRLVFIVCARAVQVSHLYIIMT